MILDGAGQITSFPGTAKGWRKTTSPLPSAGGRDILQMTPEFFYFKEQF
jgi:hypothetical protein